MKFPKFFHFKFKCPSWERISYHCIRILGILIGVAVIAYFMYDGKIRYDGTRRKAQERLIRRRMIVFIIYSCWIIGIILEQAILMWFVSYVVIISFAYCVYILLSILLHVSIQWYHHDEVSDEVYHSLAKYGLTAVSLLLLFIVQYSMYKMVDRGAKSQETRTEETTLLNKGKSSTSDDSKRCKIKFPFCV